MKKLFLMMGVACLFMVACNNAPKQQAQEEPQDIVVAEEHHCPFCPLKAEYAKWDEMDETTKAELNKKAYEIFAQMDAEMEAKKAECEANGEHKCQHDAEMTEEQKAECEAKCAEMKAKCEEMQAAWANFENLTVEEQKDLVLGRIEFMKGMQCHHEEGEGHECCHHEGEAHECQHAAE